MALQEKNIYLMLHCAQELYREGKLGKIDRVSQRGTAGLKWQCQVSNQNHHLLKI